MEKQSSSASKNKKRISLTILELMSVLAIVGLLLTWVLQRFFAG